MVWPKEMGLGLRNTSKRREKHHPLLGLNLGLEELTHKGKT